MILKPFRKKCSAFIIGAQKAGTTELFSILSLHPDIVPSINKEVHFFSSEYKYANYGLQWYKKQFPYIPIWSSKILMEATPSYMFSPLAIERIKTYNPNSKIIILLRDPVKRAFSAWNMFNKEFRKKDRDKLLLDERSFDKAIHDEVNDPNKENKRYYLSKGHYSDQLEIVFKYFDPENVLIIQSERFWYNRSNYLNKICNFLNISPYTFKLVETKHQGKGNYSESMSKEIEKELIEYYAPYNRKLFQLLNTEFDWL